MGKVAFALYSCEDLGNKGKKMIKIVPVWCLLTRIIYLAIENEMLYTNVCTRNHMLSKIRIFLALNVSLSENIVTACLQRFSNFQPTRKWVNKVKLLNFQLKTVFKYLCLSDVASAQQNILTSQLVSYAHADTPLRQSERAYCLCYFITLVNTFFVCVLLSLCNP